jgi:hypothetical protein
MYQVINQIAPKRVKRGDIILLREICIAHPMIIPGHHSS